MSILAQRFKFADAEADVAIADFKSITSSDLLNSPNLVVPDLTADMKSFLANNIQVPKIDIPKLPDGLVRDIKGAVSFAKDLKGYASKELDGLLGGFIPDNPIAQSVFNKLTKDCKTKAANNFNLGKPYDKNINCNGKSRKGTGGGCSSGGFGDVINKLTGGTYKSTFTDLNSTLSSLVGLSKLGYDMNMCGVFGALGAGLSKDLLSRASGSLLGSIGATKNVLGLFDLSGSSVGLKTLQNNPGGLTAALSGFKIPNEIKKFELSSLTDRVTGSAELLNPKWNSSTFDNMPSMSILPMDLGELPISISAKSMDRVVNVDFLDDVTSSFEDQMAAACSFPPIPDSIMDRARSFV